MRLWLAMLAIALLLGPDSSAQHAGLGQPVPSPNRHFTLHLFNGRLKTVFDTLEAYGSVRISRSRKYDRLGGITVQVDSGTAEEILDQALKNLSLVYSERRAGSVLDIYIKRKSEELGKRAGRSGSDTKAGKGLLPTDTVQVVQNGLNPVAVVNFTGAHSSVDGPTIEREVSGDPFVHLEGLNGLTKGGPNNKLGYSVWGNSTLLGVGSPLVVFGGFAWPGNLRDINLHDVDEVTLLKDAAGAGEWGAYSGNGVLVFTPREGAYGRPFHMTFTINMTVTGKPAFSYPSRMSSRSYLNADSILFTNGFFNPFFYDPQFAIPPGVEILEQEQQGTMSPGAATAAIAAMAGHNIQQDLDKYYYRPSVRQEYHLRMEGGAADHKYYASLGYERDPTDLVRNRYQRVTAFLNYGARSRDKKLEALFSGNLATVNTLNNNTGDVPVSYPYAALASASGAPLPVAYQYNPAFIDTAAGSYPLDWHYRPLQELALADNRYGRLAFYLQGSVSYHLLPGLVVEGSGQWSHGHSYTRDFFSKDGYYVRNLANSYSQQQGNGFFLPVPDANIFTAADTNSSAYNLRGKLKYSRTTRRLDKWSVMAGGEVSDVETNGQAQSIYGYNSPTGSVPMDLVTSFPVRPTGGSSPIPNNDELLRTSNRAVSLFFNGAYSWKSGFDLYGALRRDATNILGVSGNKQGGYFWSISAGKNLMAYGHAGDSALPTGKRRTMLKARMSFGSNGNISNRTANLTTQTLGLNGYGAAEYGIADYPDPSLSWERVYIANAGIDYGFFRDGSDSAGRLSGSLDLYQRWAVNLLCVDSLPPSAGVPFFTGNGAGIIGQGIDLKVKSVNMRDSVVLMGQRRNFSWTTDLWVNINRDWVSKYPYEPLSASAYVAGSFVEKGKPSTTLYSYAWAGLDPTSGDPQGRMNGLISKNYSNLMYNGGGGKVSSGGWQPVMTASLLNTVQVGPLGVSARFDCRTGYSVRRPGIAYYYLAMNYYRGTRDYDQRWQYQGQKTQVPSMPVVPDVNRDLFYVNSQALITRADNIRWRDLRVFYNVPKKVWRSLPILNVVVSAYVNNISMVWKANHDGVNPDAALYGQMPAARAYSLGIQINY